MKIAILYICTGRYNQFFSDFYNSSEKYFLANEKKHYFVFTDDINLVNKDNVTIIKSESKGFPLDSLFRFDMFLSIKKDVLNYDYAYFFNANMLFVAPVGYEILPTSQSLVALIHPGYYNKKAFLYPYERNKKSKAYIPPTLNEYKYYMGSLNGGKTKEYYDLISECSKNIHEDYNNDFIALFHDESHLNYYLSKNECLGLSPEYGIPENWSLSFTPKIIIRDKVKIDKYFNKNRNNSLGGKIKKGFTLIFRAIQWYL